MSNSRQKIGHHHCAITNLTMLLGFHLIEILVVCSILAILLLIAVPNYQQYLRNTKRAEAKVMLLRYAAALERFYFLHHTYKGASPDTLHLPSRIASKQYQIALVNVSDDTYLLHAIPQGIQAKRDLACAVLALNQRGEQSATGSASAHTCWQ
jgi:type IV pilus assembly protein PilE